MMRKQLFGDRPFYKTLLQLAMPIALQNLIMTSLNLVDTVMIGQLGETNIAAVALANQFFFLVSIFLFGVGSGASIFTAQFWGKKDITNIRRILGISLLCAVIFTALATLSILFFPKLILSFFTDDSEVIRIGSEYLKIVCFGYIPTAVSFCYASTLRSTGQPKLPTIASAAALSLNTALNYIFIFGKLGLPAMGAQGAAIATVISRIGEMILIVGAVYAMKLTPAASFQELTSLNKNFSVRFFRITMPVILNEVLWSVGVTMYTVVYGRMGTDILAAVNISSAVERLAFVLFIGISNACAIMVGNKIGEGDEETAFLYASRLITLGPLLGLVVGMIIAASSGVLLLIYHVSPSVYENARLILTIFGFVLPLKIFNMINIVGILRSGGDAKFSLILEATGVWLIAVPIAFIGGLFLHLPVHIVYLLVNLEEAFKLLFGLKRFISKRWIHNVIQNMV